MQGEKNKAEVRVAAVQQDEVADEVPMNRLRGKVAQHEEGEGEVAGGISTREQVQHYKPESSHGIKHFVVTSGKCFDAYSDRNQYPQKAKVRRQIDGLYWWCSLFRVRIAGPTITSMGFPIMAKFTVCSFDSGSDSDGGDHDDGSSTDTTSSSGSGSTDTAEAQGQDLHHSDSDGHVHVSAADRDEWRAAAEDLSEPVIKPDGSVHVGSEHVGRISYAHGARSRVFVYCRRHQCYKCVGFDSGAFPTGIAKWLAKGLDPSCNSKAAHIASFDATVYSP